VSRSFTKHAEIVRTGHYSTAEKMLPDSVYDHSGWEGIVIGEQSIDEFPAATAGRDPSDGCAASSAVSRCLPTRGASIVVIASNEQVLVLACSIAHHKHGITGLWAFC
jgi:hypothetical protein